MPTFNYIDKPEESRKTAPVPTLRKLDPNRASKASMRSDEHRFHDDAIEGVNLEQGH